MFKNLNEFRNIKYLFEDLGGELTFNSLKKNSQRVFMTLGCEAGNVVHYIYITKNNIVVISDVEGEENIVKVMDKEKFGEEVEKELHRLLCYRGKEAGFASALFCVPFQEFFRGDC